MMTEKNNAIKHNFTLDPGYLMVAVYLLSVTALVLLSWCGNAGAVIAEENQTVTLDDIKQGQLLLPTSEPGQYNIAPMLFMDVDIKISGIVARTTVKQHFKNGPTDWVEALYVFPLPDESAVDHMQMQIGDRVIIGEIQEKKEAKKTYEAAKKAGKKTSLLSQQRPNIFTTAVANIAPGETVIIQIEYQQVVKRENNIFSLRFPMVVGPRYRSGTYSLPGSTAIFSNDDNGDFIEPPQIKQIANQDGIFPPVITQSEELINPINLRIDLAAGMELARIDSLYHGIITEQKNGNITDIRFNGVVKADRDFVLEWEPKKNQAPVVSIFSEQKGDDTYMLLMVMPPEQQQQQPLARETIFILDTSGSMGGESIRQAKKALLMAVARMRPKDRFNVIEFNSVTSALFSDSRPGGSDNLQQAISWIEQLEANGGTEIKPALERALDGRDNHERIRQIVFLTDGCVNNEEPLFTLINNRIGDSRLFTIGIGSAPNSYFMTRAAAMGRGSFTFIGKLDEVHQKMTSLFTMLEQPAITDLTLTGGEMLEALPSLLPDLYQGEPMTAIIRGKGSVKDLLLSGLQGGITPWQVNLDTAKITDRPGISVLYARKQIRILLDSLSAGADVEKVKKEVTELALHNHLVSRYTSLVAVEQKVSRPENAQLQQSRVKTNLPAGWQYDKVFAGSASTATPASLLLFFGLMLLIISGLMARIHKNGKCS